MVIIKPHVLPLPLIRRMKSGWLEQPQTGAAAAWPLKCEGVSLCGCPQEPGQVRLECGALSCEGEWSMRPL